MASHRSTCIGLVDYDGAMVTHIRHGLQETGRFPTAHYIELIAKFRNLRVTVGERLWSDLNSAMSSIFDIFRQDSGCIALEPSIQLIQYLRCDGFFYWKISHFSHLKAKAIQGTSTSIFSPPFYANESRRYMMGLRLDLNGYEEGMNSHMSLFLLVMKGEFDSQLMWPLKSEVTFTLLNMTESENHTCTAVLQPFLRPTATSFKFDGLKQFIGQKEIPKYVTNDTVFIKSEVRVIN